MQQGWPPPSWGGLTRICRCPNLTGLHFARAPSSWYGATANDMAGMRTPVTDEPGDGLARMAPDRKGRVGTPDQHAKVCNVV